MAVPSSENLMFQQKQALQAWRSAVARDPNPPDVLDENLVWEILSLYAELRCSPRSKRTEIENDLAQTAYNLAQRQLERMGFEDFLRIYRDLLINAEIENSESSLEDQKEIIFFTNLLGDSYWKATSDALRKTIRQQRMESHSSELRVAKRIQQHLLPRAVPVIPGFEFAGRLDPAKEIGGDYWSMKHYAADGIMTMKLADITGHGIAAATLVAAVKFISGGFYRADQSPAWVMEKTNRVLVKETPADILVSMVYGWLYPETKRVRLVNAGHEPVLFCSSTACEDIRPTGPVMGVQETQYKEIELQFSPGDILFFASDGIVEAGITEQFGVGRLKRMVMENREMSADDLADLVIRAVYKYAGQPHDDLSLVVVKCVG